MGRKKSYKKDAPGPKPSGNVTPAADVAASAAIDETGPEDGDELAVPASPGAPPEAEPPDASPEETGAVAAAPAQAITGRPEWAATAPARLEAAEEESFWFAFSLAVSACAPPALASAAAVVAAVLALRILRALWSVPSDVAPDDIGSARMLLVGVGLTAGLYRGNGFSYLPLIWMFLTIFFFNALHNVRMMVGVELNKSKKKRREREREAAKQIAEAPPK